MKIAHLVSVLFITNLALAASQFGLTIFRATDSQQVAQIQTRLNQLTVSNRQLEEAILKLTTLDAIIERANSEKLARGNIDFVSSTHEVAFKVH